MLGVLRPKLLWPDGLSDRLTDAELESILAHEVCHVGRLDNLSALLHVVVETLFWFHPAVWWVGSRLVTERERACDEEVLHMGADNRSYAEGILKVCNFGLRSPVAFVAGVGGPRLTERIEWILTPPSPPTLSLSTRLLLAAIVAVTAGTPIAAGALGARGSMTNGVSATAACEATMPVAERPPNDPHASPFLGDWYANADRTMWASGGGPVPGTLRTKVLWVRPAGSELTISARRLDGDAGPVDVSVPSGYQWTYQASGLTFSAPGCWQITGIAGGKTLQFVLNIANPNPGLVRGTPVAATAPQSGQDAPQVYRPGGGVKPPRLVSEVKPNYTREAMEARIQGNVRLEAVVLTTGEVGDVEVTQSLDTVYGLDDEAVKAISQWRFEPGTKDGKAVAVRVEVEMTFKLKYRSRCATRLRCGHGFGHVHREYEPLAVGAADVAELRWRSNRSRQLEESLRRPGLNRAARRHIDGHHRLAGWLRQIEQLLSVLAPHDAADAAVARDLRREPAHLRRAGQSGRGD